MGRILVVDDESSMRRILVSNLRQEQHELVEANGVGDARRLLAECRFVPSLRIKRWATEKAWRFSPRCMRTTLPCQWFF
jgi:DNA-binding NtrC family response regulator